MLNLQNTNGIFTLCTCCAEYLTIMYTRSITKETKKSRCRDAFVETSNHGYFT